MSRSTKLCAVGACVALALTTAACSGGGSGTKKTGELHLGMAVANNSLNFASEMVDGAQQAAGHSKDVSLKVVGPPNTDGPAEEQLFNSLTATATDGIVLENLDPPIFTRPAANAIAKGIDVVALDTAPTDGSKITLYVGNDNYELGVLEAQQAIKRLPKNPSGVVVVGVPNPGTPVLDSRAKGIADTFKKMAPKVKVLGPYQTYSDPAQNYGAWQAQVNAHPTALAFLGVGDADSYDLAKLKQQKHGTYVVAGTDVDAKTLEDVKNGSLPFTIDPEHFLKGYIAMKLLIDHKRGASQPKGWFETPGMVVDSSNIDKVLAREKSQKAEYAFYQGQIGSMLGDVSAHMHPLKDAR